MACIVIAINEFAWLSDSFQKLNATVRSGEITKRIVPHSSQLGVYVCTYSSGTCTVLILRDDIKLKECGPLLNGVSIYVSTHFR